MKVANFKIFLALFVVIIIFEKLIALLILNFFSSIYLVDNLLSNKKGLLKFLFFPFASSLVLSQIALVDFYKSFILFALPVIFTALTKTYFIRKITLTSLLILGAGYCLIFLVFFVIFRQSL